MVWKQITKFAKTSTSINFTNAKIQKNLKFLDVGMSINFLTATPSKNNKNFYIQKHK